VRPLPDSDLSLRDASDFIFDSTLGRRALIDPHPRELGVFLREIIQSVYRLTVSCQLPEFTDHGLGHLCSLIDRLSRWTVPAPSANPIAVVDSAGFAPIDAAILLLATLFHDIGMLSQRPEDLPADKVGDAGRPLRDIPGWVRATHIDRMEALIRRLFKHTEFLELLNEPAVDRAFRVAEAHGTWPWDWSRLAFTDRDEGLAAMLAVADLLDEDALRCDSSTLLRHRYGTPLNCGHWIRHGLTIGRVLVLQGTIDIQLGKPPGTDVQMEPVFVALRNHYNLVRSYDSCLSQVGAGIVGLNFNPTSGVPATEVPALDKWSEIREFHFQSALVYHLLESFMPQALLDERRCDGAVIQRLRKLGLVQVDLTDFYRIRGELAPRTSLEQSFHALLRSF
jgi:hypothetical protein